MSYGQIYKITNQVNGKVYIGQTTRSVRIRFRQHINRALSGNNNSPHLYSAMRLFGVENFTIEALDTAETKEELDEKEIRYIEEYDAINSGYNIHDGGDINPMDSELIKQTHDDKMRSDEVRQKISKTMSEYRTTHGFSDEHKRKIQESRQKRKEERAAQGLGFYDDTSHLATRSIAVYCLTDTGERHDFVSIKEATIWQFENYHPFGDRYIHETLQRKIITSARGNEIRFTDITSGIKLVITNIKWFFVDEISIDKTVPGQNNV